jgi:ribonucleotide reductase alpha subunit
MLTKEVIDSIILQKGSVQGLNLPDNEKEIFKTVWEISQKALLEMSADRAPYICQSQSLNIFVEKPDPKVLNSVHLYGHSLGLKTGSYYIRTKPALSTQNFSMDYLKEKPETNKIFNNNSIQDNYEPCLNCSS